MQKRIFDAENGDTINCRKMCYNQLIVRVCVKENKGVCYDVLLDKSFSVTIETQGNVRDTLASIEMFTPSQILSMTI